VLLQKGLAWRDRRNAGTISLQTAAAEAGRLTDRLAALSTRKTHAGNERLASFLDFHSGEIFNFLRHPHVDV